MLDPQYWSIRLPSWDHCAVSSRKGQYGLMPSRRAKKQINAIAKNEMVNLRKNLRRNPLWTKEFCLEFYWHALPMVAAQAKPASRLGQCWPGFKPVRTHSLFFNLFATRIHLANRDIFLAHPDLIIFPPFFVSLWRFRAKAWHFTESLGINWTHSIMILGKSPPRGAK